MLAKCWLAFTSHYTVSFVVAGMSLSVIERSSTVVPMQTVIAVNVSKSFKITISFLKYDDNIQSRIVISSLHLPFILCDTNISIFKDCVFLMWFLEEQISDIKVKMEECDLSIWKVNRSNTPKGEKTKRKHLLHK